MKLLKSVLHSLALSPHFGFSQSHQYSYMAILLMSGIDKPKYILDSFLLFFYSFLLPVIFLKTILFCDSLVTILSSLFFLLLSQVSCLCVSLHSPWSFQNNFFISLTKSFSKSFFSFVLNSGFKSMKLQPSFLIEMDYSVYFFSFNP